MVEFDGQISERNQLNRMEKVREKEIIVFLSDIIFIWIVTVSFGLIFDFLQSILVELIVCTIIMLACIILIAKTTEKVALRIKLSPHIIITETDLSLELWKNGEKTWRKRNLTQVKKVLDCGEVYYIIFRFGDITNAWICQKDNVVSGTIGEFERIFRSKIVRESE